MIIAIGGRKHSGKSSIVRTLESEGYIKLSFAGKMKEILTELYGFGDVEELNSMKEVILDKPLPWGINDSVITKFAELADVNKKDINISKATFVSVREALQFIGTEVLREIDGLYHVKATLKDLDPYKNYCLDDLRFKNEMEYIVSNYSDFNGYYIIRPDVWDISNHDSETELSWNDFGLYILNDKSEEEMIETFKCSVFRGLNETSQYKEDTRFYDIVDSNSILFDEIKSGLKIIENRLYIEDETSKILDIKGDVIKENYNRIENLFLVENLKKWMIIDKKLNISKYKR